MKRTGGTHVNINNILLGLREGMTDRSKRSTLQELVRLLRQSFDHYTWVGIYLVQNGKLVLEAYDGDAATEHTTIRIGEGICGSAAKSGETIIVADVNYDPRYLMCFPSTRSEIVVPILGQEGVLGEIDIDSDKLAAFTPMDKETLERAAREVALYLENPIIAPPRVGPVREGQG